MARGLTRWKVVSSMFPYVISLLSEFGLSSLKISLSLRKFFHTGEVGIVWFVVGGVIEGICVQRVS